MIKNPSENQFSTGSVRLGMLKRSASFLGASVMTLGLLFTMTQLINNEMPELEEETRIVLPPFVHVKKEPTVEVIKQKLIMPDPTPVMQRDSFVTEVPFDAAGIANPLPAAKRFLPKITGVGGLPGGMALVPVAPRFPDRAARMGICGHVIVQYDIATSGLPVKVTILESSHRVFNKNAISAVQRARFKPDAQGGKPIAILGKQEKITFRLDDGC